MTLAITALSGIVAGLFLGVVTSQTIQEFSRFEERQQCRAIKKKFLCGKNEFTYIYEGTADFYVATVNGIEYRIKFSQKKPMKIVYTQELEPINH